MSTTEKIMASLLIFLVFALITPAILMLWRLFFKLIGAGCE